MIENGLYHYKVMPFGSKNTKTTYQRLWNHILQGKIGDIMEVYIDEMVVKSKKRMTHLVDLEDIFKQLKIFSMRINPVKCAFGV